MILLKPPIISLNRSHFLKASTLGTCLQPQIRSHLGTNASDYLNSPSFSGVIRVRTPPESQKPSSKNNKPAFLSRPPENHAPYKAKTPWANGLYLGTIPPPSGLEDVSLYLILAAERYSYPIILQARTRLTLTRSLHSTPLPRPSLGAHWAQFTARPSSQSVCSQDAPSTFPRPSRGPLPPRPRRPSRAPPSRRSSPPPLVGALRGGSP